MGLPKRDNNDRHAAEKGAVAIEDEAHDDFVNKTKRRSAGCGVFM
jgi:hypothetical protein